MDLNKIFIKNACPTKMGGQAVMNGIMMRGSRGMAIAVRKPDGSIHLAKGPLNPPGKLSRIPVLRGVAAFVSSLSTGMKILMYSADKLEEFENEQNAEAPATKEKKPGKAGAFVSVFVAMLITVAFFIVLPAFTVNLLKKAGLENVILLNLSEGFLRISIFAAYVFLISRMEEIKTVFRYHGAEHKTIHCYENGLELTPENAQSFYTLHPRCGTSFLMFVMIISILVFSFFGWPDLRIRIAAKILMLPVIAGLSYELLQFTGRHAGPLVKILSLPGILLQKLTTAEPDLKQLEVAIAALNAVAGSQEDQSAEISFWAGTIYPDRPAEKDEDATEEFKKMMKQDN